MPIRKLISTAARRTALAYVATLLAAAALTGCGREAAPPKADVPAAENSGRKITIAARPTPVEEETTATEVRSDSAETTAAETATTVTP